MSYSGLSAMDFKKTPYMRYIILLTFCTIIDIYANIYKWYLINNYIMILRVRKSIADSEHRRARNFRYTYKSCSSEMEFSIRESVAINTPDTICTQTQTQTWFIQRKIIQIQNISGHQYIKWTYVQWKGQIVTATALLHLPKTEGESPPHSAATSQWRPLRSNAYNGAFLT